MIKWKEMVLTRCFGDCTDQDRWYGHDNAPYRGYVAQHLRSSSSFRGQDTLEIYLPRDTTEYQQKTIIHVRPVFPRLHFTDPIHLHRLERLHLWIGPSEWNAHPLCNENYTSFLIKYTSEIYIFKRLISQAITFN